jgi:glyoxylase-like metal-dependent hydrolase (beta-lactamase superfamily II)
MKRLHRRDLYCWSTFNERLNIDFNAFAWVREGGNLLIDPLPLSAHDLEHLRKLGGAAAILVTNSYHVRGAVEIAAALGARVWGPAGERAGFPVACERWLGEGDEPLPGLVTLALDGSKTRGELALVLDETTLICGDLVRAHRAGSLMMLQPEQGLADRAKAVASIDRLAALPRIEAVLVGDGWSVFHDGRARLAELCASLRQ